MTTKKTKKTYNIAVVGATGNVGREILRTLAERDFPVGEVYALCSLNSVGKEVSFGGKVLKTVGLNGFDFSDIDIAFGAVDGKIISGYEDVITEHAVLIDNSSYFRMDEDVPLVVPEVNGFEIAKYSARNIIANPNCSTIQMLAALHTLHSVFNIKRIVVSTYQAVSGAGKDAMDELYIQTKKLYEVSAHKPSVFPTQIAFNCIPQIDDFMEDGYTKEEWKMKVETKKILSESVEVTATCVRVPVFNGHAESINVEFEKPCTVAKVKKILSSTDGVLVFDKNEPRGYKTQTEISQEDAVFVSRIRQDETVENGINMWVVADNMRKGAALNAVQIAEILASKYLAKEGKAKEAHAKESHTIEGSHCCAIDHKSENKHAKASENTKTKSKSDSSKKSSR